MFLDEINKQCEKFIWTGIENFSPILVKKGVICFRYRKLSKKR